MRDNNITVIGKDAFGMMRVLSKLSLSGNKVVFLIWIVLQRQMVEYVFIYLNKNPDFL